MAYPVIYDVSYSYTGFQQAQGNNNFPGTQLDADLAGLRSSVSSLALFTQGVMRSDGALNNGIVTFDSLSASLQTAGLAGASAWLTGVAYTVGSPVVINGNLYRCAVAHTSGVFATDLAAGKWVFVASLLGSFTQQGVGALPLNIADYFKNSIITPEMFGGYVGAADATAGIQAAINFALTLGAKVDLKPARYNTTSPLTVPSNGLRLSGAMASLSPNLGTEIYFMPSGTDQAAIDLTAGAGILSSTEIEHLTIRTGNTTAYKTGIRVRDGSLVTLRKVNVAGFNGGQALAISGAAASPSGEVRLTVVGAAVSLNDGWAAAVSGITGLTDAAGNSIVHGSWSLVVSGGNTVDLKGSRYADATTGWAAGGTLTLSSQGIQTKGRELIKTDEVAVVADIPLRMSKNPNFATIGLDESNFANLTLSASGSNAIVLVDDGVAFTSLTFSGWQSWGGGRDGFVWRDRSAGAISQQIRLDNIRQEQKSAAGGTHFIIKPNTTIYSLGFGNASMSDRDGIIARNVANLNIYGAHYLNAVGKALDIDATVQNTTLTGCQWIAGSTAVLSGQILQSSSGQNPATGALPGTAVYSSTRSRNKSAGLDVDDTITAVAAIQSGATGSVNGQFQVKGLTSGTGTAIAQNVMGTPTWKFPTNSGTFAVSASTPLAIDTATGNVTLTGAAAGQVLAGATPAFTATPTLGVPGSLVGTLAFGNLTSGTITLSPPVGALGSVTLSLPAVTATLATRDGAETLSNKTLAATTLSGAISGGGNNINNVNIGAVSPGTAAFSTMSTTGNATVGNGAASTSIIVNGTNSGSNGGGQNVVQNGGVAIIAIGNYDKVVTGGPYDATPTLYGATRITVNIGGTDSVTIGAPTASTSKTTGTIIIPGTGGLGVGGAIYAGGEVATGSVTVATLPAAAGRAGAHHFVTDANATFTAGIGAVVAAGGANAVPVTCDGTNWRIG